VNEDATRDRAIEQLIRRQADAAAPASAECVDADTLAAWADGALRERLAAVEAHAADCARCQALLAAMVRTSPAEEPKIVWWRAATLFRWGTPLAAAAALILWISIGRQGQAPAPAPQMASRVEPPPAGAQPTEAVRPAAPPASQPVQEKPAPREERSAPRRRQESGRLTIPAPEQPAPAVVGGVSTSELRPDAAARTAAAEPMAKAGRGAPAPSPPPAAAPVATPALDAITRRFAGVPLEVSSPDRSVRWRTTGGPSVERSSDGGTTWTAQPLESPVVFTAGVSTAADVCWLVGPAGAVFLSTDGRTFRRLPFPETANLVAVRATDARTATVTTADGRRLGTSDGGQTWTPQEIPTAPF